MQGNIVLPSNTIDFKKTGKGGLTRVNHQSAGYGGYFFIWTLYT
jgi:hypothetical protein